MAFLAKGSQVEASSVVSCPPRPFWLYNTSYLYLFRPLIETLHNTITAVHWEQIQQVQFFPDTEVHCVGERKERGIS